MLSEQIIKDVDYIVLVEKEKRARLDSDMINNAAHCVELVSYIINIS